MILEQILLVILGIICSWLAITMSQEPEFGYKVFSALFWVIAILRWVFLVSGRNLE